MKTIPLAALLVLGSMSAASAASFDCAKASTPVEKAICSSPDLGRRDEILATAYATALGGLDDEARSAMQADQRAWLKYAELSCTDDATPFTKPLDADQQSCLLNNFSARIRTLSESRMEGDWRLYVHGTYNVVDDPDPDVYQKVSSNELVSPRIDDDSDTARAFNALMEEADEAQMPNPTDEGYASSDTSIVTTVTSVGSKRISLENNSWWFGHGAAHGNYTITYSHYLTDEERMLDAADLFKGKGWEKALGDLALAELERTLGDNLWEESRPDVATAAVDPSRWNITDEALEIRFQPYEVTAYAAGAPTVSIPWDSLGSYLVDDYFSLVY
jgi:uncharacterized protein